MKYFVDLKSNLILTDLDKDRYPCSSNFDDRFTHYLILDDEQVKFYMNNSDANAREVWNKKLDRPDNPEIIDSIDEMRVRLIKDIKEYDKSSDVNSFYVGGKSVWIDRDTRVSLMNTISILEGELEEVRIWTDSDYIVLPCEVAKGILKSVEKYAFECYNVTQQHIQMTYTLDTKEQIEEYNYKTNYPEKLHFEL